MLILSYLLLSVNVRQCRMPNPITVMLAYKEHAYKEFQVIMN